MKKIILILTVCITGTMHSQNFSTGSSAINLGIGLDSFHGTGSGYKQSLPFEGQYETFIKDNISVGGFIGYQTAKLSDSFSDGYTVYSYSIKESFLMIGALANYKFYDSGKFNAYGGAKLGYCNVSETETGITGYPTSSASGILLGLQAGGRYFFSNSIAANAELGYGISLLKIGLTFKLK